jgi:hypothetical protein
MAERLGIANLELAAHPIEGVLEAMEELRGQVDVVVLYAVLEHLDVEQRLEVLRRAREVVREDGFIAVCETPNRFFPFDHHTSLLPFFQMLPDEVALRFYERSSRQEFLNAIGEAVRGGPEAAARELTLWGRGVSFHEFELVFGDLGQYVAASNYDLTLFPERPVQPEELALARYMQRVRPELAPVWSRAWLDLILTPWPMQTRPSFLRPWTLQTVESPGVAWTAAERARLPDAVTPLKVTLPEPTAGLVVGAAVDARQVTVSVRAPGMSEPLSERMRGEAGQGHYVPFELDEPARELDVQLSRPGEIFFVGYQD